MVNPFEGFIENSPPYLRVVGCWYHKEDSFKNRVFSISYAIFCFLTTYVLYLTLVFLSLIKSTDSDGIVEHIRNLTVLSTSLVKCINFYLHRKTFFDTIKILTSDEFNYEVCGSLNPTLIVKKYYEQSERWRKSFTVLLCGVIFWPILFPIFLHFFHGEDYYVIENGESIYKQPLPGAVLNPFGQKTKVDYIKGYFFAAFGLFIQAMTFCSFNVLYSSMMSCASAHLAVLAKAFKSIHPRCQERLKVYDDDNSILQNEMDLELLKCIKHLQTLHKIFKYLNQIFRLQVLAHAGGFLSLMGCNIFRVVYKGANILDLAAVFTAMFDFFLCCWFGNMLTEGNNTLRESLYFTNWRVASKGFKKSLIITMEVLKTPIHITIAGLVPLTLETYVSFLRTSYSTYTMLQSMVSE